jgi:hypothetical protein
MNAPWFSNVGQIIQTVIALSALVLSGVMAWPQLRENNLLTGGAIIFYLMVGWVLVSAGLVATRVARRQHLHHYPIRSRQQHPHHQVVRSRTGLFLVLLSFRLLPQIRQARAKRPSRFLVILRLLHSNEGSVICGNFPVAI